MHTVQRNGINFAFAIKGNIRCVNIEKTGKAVRKPKLRRGWSQDIVLQEKNCKIMRSENFKMEFLDDLRGRNLKRAVIFKRHIDKPCDKMYIINVFFLI